jgi:1,4-alpha-glucan branching enzyme
LPTPPPKPETPTPAPVAITERGGHPSLLSDLDLHLFNEGTHYRLYDHFGAHEITWKGQTGTYFAVWAPNAHLVSLVGDFNDWKPGAHPMRPLEGSGVWETFAPELKPGTTYKYHVESKHHAYRAAKTDPFGTHQQKPPETASIVHPIGGEHAHRWRDDDWMRTRHERQAHAAPISIYECHLGSWRRHPDGRFYTYRELAKVLPDYLADLGFTHVELLPVMEHPFDKSWGYQTVGYFAPTSRHGSPQDFMALIDALHQRNIGVILDWVPSHFPSDEHGLGYFDGTHLYEHADERQGFHPDWKSLIFNYGRHEIRSFLISSAAFWLDRYHADGLRVDAVASMLYLDYSREDGEWIPNRHGGNENLEAIDFLKRLNTEVYGAFPGIQTFAEESTAWPRVSKPVHEDGLGFGFKWDMGWMHDTLNYLRMEPIHRKYHHNQLTFRGMYMHAESYTLPLSHDEVVHGKRSLRAQMPGDDWQAHANLRLLLTNQWLTPGKKLLFMGAEFAQRSEWNSDAELDWSRISYRESAGVMELVRALNRLYKQFPALHVHDADGGGFRWLLADEADTSVVAFARFGDEPEQVAICLYNYTPVPRDGVAVGVPHAGEYAEVLNTDSESFGGSNVGNLGSVRATDEPLHGMPHRVHVTLPPLAAVVLTFVPEPRA